MAITGSYVDESHQEVREGMILTDGWDGKPKPSEIKGFLNKKGFSVIPGQIHIERHPEEKHSFWFRMQKRKGEAR